MLTGNPHYSILDFFSSADFYWRLDGVVDNTVSGWPASVVAKTSAGFLSKTTAFNPGNRASKADQRFLTFDGATNRITVSNIQSACVFHPDSDACPHGFTTSFAFKDNQKTLSSSPGYVLDTLGGKTAGWTVRIIQ